MSGYGIFILDISCNKPPENKDLESFPPSPIQIAENAPISGIRPSRYKSEKLKEVELNLKKTLHELKFKISKMCYLSYSFTNNKYNISPKFHLLMLSSI